MSRMKTFLLYFLGIVGFFILSLILEDALIGNMYKKMDGNIQDNAYAIVVEGVSGRATNVNGYMKFRLSNTSSAKQNNYSPPAPTSRSWSATSWWMSWVATTRLSKKFPHSKSGDALPSPLFHG